MKLISFLLGWLMFWVDEPGAGGAAGALGAGGAPAGGAPSWFEGFDDETKGTVAAKGWQSPADAVKAYRSLESTFGADRAGRTFTIPKTDDPKEWEGVWSKLGRPEKVDDYGIATPQGGDDAYTKHMLNALHQSGLSKKQAEALFGAHQGYMSEAQKAAAQAEQLALQQEHEQLQRDWGNGPEAARQKELARRGFAKLAEAAGVKVPENVADLLEKGVGFAGVLKMMAKAGELLGEKPADGLDGSPGSFGMTPGAALSTLNAKSGDPNWAAKVSTGKGPEYEEYKRLTAIAASHAESMALQTRSA